MTLSCVIIFYIFCFRWDPKTGQFKDRVWTIWLRFCRWYIQMHCTILHSSHCILTQISLNFLPEGLVNNMSTSDSGNYVAMNRHEVGISISGAGIILCMCPANERQHYNVTSLPIGWVHTQNDPWWWSGSPTNIFITGPQCVNRWSSIEIFSIISLMVADKQNYFTVIEGRIFKETSSYLLVIITVPAGGPAPLGVRVSEGIVMTWPRSGPAYLQGWKAFKCDTLKYLKGKLHFSYMDNKRESPISQFEIYLNIHMNSFGDKKWLKFVLCPCQRLPWDLHIMFATLPDLIVVIACQTYILECICCVIYWIRH